MGNTAESITNEEREEMVQLIHDIFQIDCPILDIGERQGATGYIDFIQPKECLPMMKGRDRYGRPFIVFKSRLTMGNKGPIECFTTFFKRYKEESNMIYHTAGHYGRLLFATEGGTTLRQLRTLYDLLSKGTVEMTYQELRENRICQFRDDFLNNEEVYTREREEEEWELIKNMIGRITI
jgi:hypothetical protein